MRLLGARQRLAVRRLGERQRLAEQRRPVQALPPALALLQEVRLQRGAHWRLGGQLQGVRRPALEDLGWRVRRQAAATDSARCSRISSRRAEMASRAGLGGNCCRAG